MYHHESNACMESEGRIDRIAITGLAAKRGAVRCKHGLVGGLVHDKIEIGMNSSVVFMGYKVQPKATRKLQYHTEAV